MTSTTFCDEYLEKIDKLLALRFTEHIRTKETGFSIRGDRQDEESWLVTVEENGPTPDDLDAFLLTFRMFFHDRGELPLGKLEKLYDTFNLDPENTKNLRLQLKSLRKYLHSLPDGISFVGFEPPMTRDRIIRLFLFGDLGHLDPQQRALYRALRDAPDLLAALRFVFLEALRVYLRFLEEIGREAVIGARRDLERLQKT